MFMPVMDGWTFLKERNDDPNLRRIPVVVFSGQADTERQILAEHAHFLKKPVSLEELTDVIEHVAA
jgi:CheY-like chemotaxis protein